MMVRSTVYAWACFQQEMCDIYISGFFFFFPQAHDANEAPEARAGSPTATWSPPSRPCLPILGAFILQGKEFRRRIPHQLQKIGGSVC